MRTNNLRNTIRSVINEQPGTGWCTNCMQIHPPNYCAAGGRPCNANFDKDSLSCQACKNLFPSYQSSAMNTHCNQQGQPCYTTTTPYVSPGKGWAQDTRDQDMQAKKGGGRDTVKLRESELINIINRTINESQLLKEYLNCEELGGMDCEKTCCHGGDVMGTMSGCKSRHGGVCQTQYNCPGDGNCGDYSIRPGGTNDLEHDADAEREVATSKPGGNRNNKAKDEKIEVSESELINIIKRTVNESQLLSEEPGCRGWFDCPTCGGGRTTCKKGGKEINTSDGGGECGCDDTYSTSGGCGRGHVMGARGCVCINPKLCGEQNMTMADVKVLQDNPDPIIQKSIRCFFCPKCSGCYRQKNPRDPSLDGRG